MRKSVAHLNNSSLKKEIWKIRTEIISLVLLLTARDVIYALFVANKVGSRKRYNKKDISNLR